MRHAPPRPPDAALPPGQRPPPRSPLESSPPAISLVLIDDNRLTRAGLVALLRGRPGYRIHATSADTAVALRIVRRVTPNIVVLNMRQADDDALTLAGALHGETPGARIIVMGLDVGAVDVESLVRAGVAGFIMSTAGLGDFLDTVRCVARDERVLPPALAHGLFRQLKRHGPHWRRKPVTGTGRLTAREREVADLVVRGLGNQAIAGRLAIALDTVRSHVHRVLAKLDCNTRLDVAVLGNHEVHGSSAALSAPGAWRRVTPTPHSRATHWTAI